MSTIRDHALSGLAGLLVGFVAAYFLFESVASQQPPRRAFHGAGGAEAAPPPPPSNGGGMAPSGGGAPRAPFMERANEIQQRIAAAPEDPSPRLELANLYFDAGLWPQAEAAYGGYLEIRPDDPDALSDLGVSLYQQGSFDQALANFRRVRELAPDHWESRFNEAVVLAFGLRRYDEAEALVEELRRMQPDNPNVERLAAGIEEGKSAA